MTLTERFSNSLNIYNYLLINYYCINFKSVGWVRNICRHLHYWRIISQVSDRKRSPASVQIEFKFEEFEILLWKETLSTVLGFDPGSRKIRRQRDFKFFYLVLKLYSLSLYSHLHIIRRLDGSKNFWTVERSNCTYPNYF